MGEEDGGGFRERWRKVGREGMWMKCRGRGWKEVEGIEAKWSEEGVR